MEKSEVRKIVIDEICRIQELSGRQLPMEPDDDWVPLLQCDGFDSLNGAEAAVRISEQAGCPLPTNPFANGIHPLSLEQIIANVLKLINRRQNGKGQ
jgi:hypothetical protein